MSILENGGGVRRTNDPIFSFAIKGAKQDLFLKDTTSCFGKDCVYEILTKENGKLINFGNTESYTYIHYPEEVFKIFYRHHKNFNGIIIDENGESYKKDINYFVRINNIYPDGKKIENFLIKTNNYKTEKIAGLQIHSSDCKKIFEDTIKAFKENEKIFIKTNYD